MAQMHRPPPASFSSVAPSRRHTKAQVRDDCPQSCQLPSACTSLARAGHEVHWLVWKTSTPPSALLHVCCRTQPPPRPAAILQGRGLYLQPAHVDQRNAERRAANRGRPAGRAGVVAARQEEANDGIISRFHPWPFNRGSIDADGG
ncbi:hypothetical protein AAFF_G00033900 [Aldrovandia affinis]|uniref:Uncharacterized protein n=1 Tax=Aldrovandia affinis TaxID=143900 RepID=A0AAD7S3U4_9TELE|nr:hypothetical protein AAFF_G00033900 [Aldrovandia affinis]